MASIQRKIWTAYIVSKWVSWHTVDSIYSTLHSPCLRPAGASGAGAGAGGAPRGTGGTWSLVSSSGPSLGSMSDDFHFILLTLIKVKGSITVNFIKVWQTENHRGSPETIFVLTKNHLNVRSQGQPCWVHLISSELQNFIELLLLNDSISCITSIV